MHEFEERDTRALESIAMSLDKIVGLLTDAKKDKAEVRRTASDRQWSALPSRIVKVGQANYSIDPATLPEVPGYRKTVEAAKDKDSGRRGKVAAGADRGDLRTVAGQVRQARQAKPTRKRPDERGAFSTGAVNAIASEGRKGGGVLKQGPIDE